MIEDLVANLVGNLAYAPLFMSLLGVALGLLFGAMPGLNQGVLMALTLPLTFHMDSIHAQFLLVGMYVGGVSGAMVTGVVLGIPGSPAAVMTTFDGHAMARKGQAARALALGVTSSFIGGMLSWLVLATLAAPLARFALKNFSGFEFSALIIGGLMMIATASSHDLLKGMISGALGVLVGLFGLDLVSQEPRFTFGYESLETGFAILPVLLGIFAVGHIIYELHEERQIADQVAVRMADVLRSITAAGKHWVNLFRSSLIGTWIGILPGIGANIGSVIAYTVARNLSREPEKFGSGTEEGVVASESGNNSTIGGALIPMIAMGIPGSPADVILMAALLFHNIQPGPLLIIEHPDAFYGIISTLLYANVFMFVVLIALCAWLGRIADLPKYLLVPGIFVIATIGIYSTANRLFDIWVLIAFGIVGFLMRAARLPSAAFVIGFILSPLLEVKLRSSLMESGGSFLPFVTRPLSLGILLFSLGFVLWPFAARAWSRSRERRAA